METTSCTWKPAYFIFRYSCWGGGGMSSCLWHSLCCDEVPMVPHFDVAGWIERALKA